MIGVRTHGGPRIGLGHGRRCLTLAIALHRLGAPVLFIVEDDASTVALIERHGFECHCVEVGRAEPNATIEIVRDRCLKVLIADSYDIDTPYLEAVQPHVETLVTLDDLADRALPVDVVINAAIDASQLPYARLTQARLLLGPQYCLLREEFAREPDRLIQPNVSRILITIGGSDPQHLTARLMDWARQVQPTAQLDVIIGPFFDQRLDAADARVTLHHDPANMRELMLGCDLAICSGGQTTLELAATGTPALAIQLADNQAHNLTDLNRAGTLHLAGRGDDRDLAERITGGLTALIADPSRRAVMSMQGRALIDGRGAARVAQAILAEFHRGHYAEDQNR
jgi:UDP-2,4-diacetamido-2,4,6-trideoxy-beta-L-altropyranose hydrolase